MDIDYQDFTMSVYLLRDIPDNLWHGVKVRAAIDGRTMRQVLLDASEQDAKDVRLVDPAIRKRRNVKRQ